MESQEQEALLPEEEVVEPVKKKREKKKKSKEERSKDRRMVFVLLIITLVMTGWFYVWPRIRSRNFGLPKIDLNMGKGKNENSGWKGYTEVKM